MVSLSTALALLPLFCAVCLSCGFHSQIGIMSVSARTRLNLKSKEEATAGVDGDEPEGGSHTACGGSHSACSSSGEAGGREVGLLPDGSKMKTPKTKKKNDKSKPNPDGEEETMRDMYTASLHQSDFMGPTDRSHLRLGMTVLGMVYTCEAIGFLKPNNEPPRCSTQQEGRVSDWVLADWELTYDRGEPTKDTMWLFENGPELVVYDLAHAIRRWLDEHEHYNGLSMCEVALWCYRNRSC